MARATRAVACDTSSDAGHPALVAFIGGLLARRWRAPGEARMRRELAARLTAALGPEAGAVIAATFRDWTDDPSGGGYSDLVLDLDAHHAGAVSCEGVGPLQFVRAVADRKSQPHPGE